MKLQNVILLLIYLSSSLYLTSFFNSIAQIVMVSLSVLLMCGFIVVNIKKNKMKINIPLIIPLFFIFVFGCFSAIYNNDIRLFFGICGFTIIIFSLVHLYPNFKNEANNSVIAQLILISQIPLVVISFFWSFEVPFRGIFYNPNSLGTILCTVYTVILAKYLYTLEEKVKKRSSLFKSQFFRVLSLSIFALLTAASGSRTSLVTLVVVTFVGVLLLSTYIISKKKIKSFLKIFYGMLLMIIFGMFILVFISPSEYYTYIFEKFERKMTGGNLFAGRLEVWSITIENATAFGKGRNYFSEVGQGAHNTFVSLIGQYGVLMTISLFLYLLVGLIMSLKYIFVTNNDKYKYLPILLISTLFLLSMGESMMLKLSMLATFSSIGIISIKRFNI